MTSGSEPGRPAQAPYVFSYDSTTAMTLKWTAPSTSGGFPITSMKLYVDGAELVELNQSQNYYQVTGLSLGAILKVQVSALNEVDESVLSPSSMLTFANVPDAPASLTLMPRAASPTSIITIAWEAPTSLNGDTVASYRVYLDNGRGGPFTMIYEGVPSSYSYEAGIEE